MKTSQQYFGFSKSILALAVLAAYAPAYADDAEIAQLTQPTSSISVGVGASSGSQKDRSLMGQYNGLRDNDTTLQVDLDINKRDEATGTSLYIKGNNLGLDNRDLSVSYENQGNWKLGADYSELVHHEIRTINTGMVGLGSTTPSVVRLATPGTGQDYDLKLKRVGLGLSGEKWLNKNLQFEVAFRNETKTGARTYGVGYACAAYVCTNTQTATNQTWALLLLPEPVDTTTRQIEARLNYHDQKFSVSAGYYGSFFTNANGNMTAAVPNSLNNPLGVLSTLAPATTNIAGGGTSLRNVLQSPIALQPDNQAHQFYVSGNYRFTPTTQGNFKVAYTHATQDDNFLANGLTNAPAGVTSLNGVVDTKLVQLGVTARPMPKLSLLANVRYEDKKDSSTEALYNVEGGAVVPATTPATYVNRSWYNYLASSTKVVGKLEASYQLPVDLRGTIGLDYSSYDRPVPVSITEEELAGLGAVRAKNTEKGYRLELRRSMSETLTGSVGYSNSKRTGGDWTSLSNSAAFVAAGLGYGQTGSASQFIALNAGNAFPMNMVDIDRDKIKLSANWMPNDKVEVQFNVEDGKDKNATAFNPVAGQKGWLESSTRQYSLDASFAVTDKWKINGYLSQGTQNQKINHSTGYMADLETRSDGIGLGVKGVISSNLEVGAQLTYLNDTTKYGLRAASGVTGTAPTAANLAQAAIGVPDVSYQSTTLNLYGKYALRKNADIRFSLIHQRAELREWSWTNNGRAFVYQDNTTVGMNPDQSVTFLGVSYIYKF
ncbi:MtrB/PioB family decaheme-associated outer membrane protein [Rhodoferax sp.]|uniref:MtrB/PioB family decaheme-associated outer membrane protein n=1 Tax=Rhodoferax sp. TaxID=50421 RepID=UPI00260C92C3|nr:MtrB/PioB family decaheme-associated outer membrane protein [Rhodoferax sp.]MDD2924293.1 MtrB/PioB family decaheme-associated outer membrane protein [Rhodoferax sp.]